MKSKVILTVQELKEILELAGKFDSDRVTIKFDNSSGIGTVVQAEFDIDVQGVSGEFTVTVSDEKDW